MVTESFSLNNKIAVNIQLESFSSFWSSLGVIEFLRTCLIG